MNTEETKQNRQSFAQLGLSEGTLSAIVKKGFEEPTEIQSMTIPVMLGNEKNIIAQAQTGTGKTAAFGLPLIDMIDPKVSKVKALILVPTRELAIQVAEEINSLKGQNRISVIPIYGGQSIEQQFRRLKKGIHIVVGSPGRIIDHLNRGTLALDEIDHLILDEADEMLNMGFIEDIETIMEHTNPEKKTLLFSATMPDRIKALARKYMTGYDLLKAKKQQLTVALTEQIYFEVRAGDKFEALCRIIDMEPGFYAIVFCRTKNDVDTVSSHLLDRGYDAEGLHGDISQFLRERTLNKFRNKRVNILVATDVAARGIDIENLTHVINYSLPQDPESYVHRIGRTGRAGKEGTAITFITPSEYKRLMFIRQKANADIKKSRVPRVKDIIRAKKQKISQDLERVLSKDVNKAYTTWAEKLLTDKDPNALVAGLLSYCFENELNPEGYGEIEEISGGGRQLDKQGKARLFIALGRKDKLQPRRLVELLMSRAPIRPNEIRDVMVSDTCSFVTVPFHKAEEIVRSFHQKGRRPLVSHARNKG